MSATSFESFCRETTALETQSENLALRLKGQQLIKAKIDEWIKTNNGNEDMVALFDKTGKNIAYGQKGTINSTDPSNIIVDIPNKRTEEVTYVHGICYCKNDEVIVITHKNDGVIVGTSRNCTSCGHSW